MEVVEEVQEVVVAVVEGDKIKSAYIILKTSCNFVGRFLCFWKRVNAIIHHLKISLQLFIHL